MRSGGPGGAGLNNFAVNDRTKKEKQDAAKGRQRVERKRMRFLVGAGRKRLGAGGGITVARIRDPGQMPSGLFFRTRIPELYVSRCLKKFQSK